MGKSILKKSEVTTLKQLSESFVESDKYSTVFIKLENSSTGSGWTLNEILTLLDFCNEINGGKIISIDEKQNAKTCAHNLSAYLLQYLLNTKKFKEELQALLNSTDSGVSGNQNVGASNILKSSLCFLYQRENSNDDKTLALLFKNVYFPGENIFNNIESASSNPDRGILKRKNYKKPTNDSSPNPFSFGGLWGGFLNLIKCIFCSFSCFSSRAEAADPSPVNQHGAINTNYLPQTTASSDGGPENPLLGTPVSAANQISTTTDPLLQTPVAALPTTSSSTSLALGINSSGIQSSHSNTNTRDDGTDNTNPLLLTPQAAVLPLNAAPANLPTPGGDHRNSTSTGILINGMGDVAEFDPNHLRDEGENVDDVRTPTTKKFVLLNYSVESRTGSKTEVSVFTTEQIAANKGQEVLAILSEGGSKAASKGEPRRDVSPPQTRWISSSNLLSTPPLAGQGSGSIDLLTTPPLPSSSSSSRSAFSPNPQSQ